MSERLDAHHAALVLRAKAALLEHHVLASAASGLDGLSEHDELCGDVALVATLLADEIERREAQLA